MEYEFQKKKHSIIGIENLNGMRLDFYLMNFKKTTQINMILIGWKRYHNSANRTKLSKGSCKSYAVEIGSEIDIIPIRKWVW